jgi:sialidase-1
MVNEVQMVELDDGSVRLNSRRADEKPFRKTAVSRDGGQSWSNVEQVEQLPDPTCMGSILRCNFATSKAKGRILYSGPTGPGRTKGTIYVSNDDGGTWPVSKVLCPGPFAYSCLTRLKDGSIGILYETGKKKSYETLTFSRVPSDWLEK